MATHDELKRVRDNLACALNMGGVQDAARWTIDELDRLLAEPVRAGVPEVTGIGRDADHPRALVLYLRTEPSDDSVRAIQDALRAPAVKAEQADVCGVCQGQGEVCVGEQTFGYMSMQPPEPIMEVCPECGGGPNPAAAGEPESTGYDQLWLWFGLSYAAWLTLPRVLMHEMPDDWQAKMAALLEQWDAAWNLGAFPSPEVTAKADGKYRKWPVWILNYRHPDRTEIERLRAEHERRGHER